MKEASETLLDLLQLSDQELIELALECDEESFDLAETSSGQALIKDVNHVLKESKTIDRNRVPFDQLLRRNLTVIGYGEDDMTRELLARSVVIEALGLNITKDGAARRNAAGINLIKSYKNERSSRSDASRKSSYKVYERVIDRILDVSKLDSVSVNLIGGLLRQKDNQYQEQDDHEIDLLKSFLTANRKQFVGVKEAAELLGVDRTRIQQYARAGRLGTNIAGRWVFTLKELKQFEPNPDGKHLEE